MLGDDDGGVLGDIAGSLLRTGLDDEAAETTEVNGFAVRKRILDYFHEFFDGFQNCGFSMPVVFEISFTISALVIVVMYA